MIDESRRKRFLENLNDAYAALRTDSEAWRELQSEGAQWEAISDGLPDEETWTEDGTVVEEG
jgi:hypothetical protein